uniref:Retrotransposon gag domain-containing protein n=1 Tax=Tanacetum cinerariifolium TaxID=118510 RepID=A0A6L2JEC1_TANCI|nr:hypothetical protein [Tanacetum cinerariifolium]
MGKEEGTRQIGGQQHMEDSLNLNFPNLVKLMLVSIHLFDNALNWHKQFMTRNGDNATWQMYEVGIKERFDLVHEDPMIELKILKQPTKLTDVYSLAKMQEATLVVSKNKYSPILSTPKTTTVIPYVAKSGGYKPKINTLALPSTTQTMRTNRPRKPLIRQEMEEKMAKHMCFHCDQRYSPGHKCSGQMYYLEIFACDELIEDEDCELTKQGVLGGEENMP